MTKSRILSCCDVLTAVQSQTPGDGDDDKASSVAGSNAEEEAPAAVSALAEIASREFSPQLTTKILELLCDESVSFLCVDIAFPV